MYRTQGKLPSNTKANPKDAAENEYVNAIGFRSKKVWDEIIIEKKMLIL